MSVQLAVLMRMSLVTGNDSTRLRNVFGTADFWNSRQF
jgi:hypothetical protein